MMPVRRRNLLGGALLAAVACTNPVQLCGCVLPPPAVSVVGTVASGSGAPVSAARVSVRVMPEGCNAAAAVTLPPDPEARPRTGAAGDYRIDFPFVHGAAGHCVQVVAVRAAADSVLSAPASFTPQGGDPVTLTVNLGFP